VTVNDAWVFTESEKKIISSIVTKGDEEEKRNEKFAIIDFDSFYRLLTKDEIAIVKKYLSINPSKIGYKLPCLGLEGIPKDIVPIPNQTYVLNGQKAIIPCRYLPKETYQAYKEMNNAMKSKINKGVLVSHGYRSTACQVFKFFNTLKIKYDYDFTKTVRRICFPGYSQHACAKRQAIDFITEGGVKGPDFEKTNEHQWLQKNAKRFHFFQSYPKHNTVGMMYEPWHWQYRV
jgi:hypothetical protein